jgi:WD40 repeat protein
MIFGRSRPLFCDNNHRWHPFRDWPLPAHEGRLVCPTCQGVLRMAIPLDRIRDQRRREKRLNIAAGLILLPLFPVFVFLTWLSVSRWGVQRLVVSPVGDNVAVARTTLDGGGRVQVWNPVSGKEVARFGGEGQRIFGGGGDVVLSPVFLPIGKTLLLVKEEEGRGQPVVGKPGSPPISTILKWDFWGGKPANFKGHYTVIRSLSLGPSGKTLALACIDHTVLLWDYPSGKERGKLSHGANVHCMALDPTGKMLATGTLDGKVMLWSLAAATREKVLSAHHLLVKDLAFSPDGRVLATVGGLDRTLKLWDARSGKEQAAHAINLDWLNCVAFSPDGKQLAVGGGTFQGRGAVQVWDWSDGKQEKAFQVATSTVVCTAFTRDGKCLLAGSGHTTSIATWASQGRVHCWDLATSEEKLALMD